MLEAFPNPERKGCPDEETLKALAERRLPLNNPAMVHVASCSECYAEYRNYRLDMEELQQVPMASTPVLPSSSANTTKPALVPASGRFINRTGLLAVAAAVLLMVGLGGYEIYQHPHVHPYGADTRVEIAARTPVPADVDLSDATTLRGGTDKPNSLQEVTLPAALVRLSVRLPRFSQSGGYTILVSKDRAGRQILAQGNGTTVNSEGKVVKVTLDLRKANPGSYFLATVRGSDNGTYYYPLQVK